MSLILNIDTSVETASVCLAKDGKPLQLLINSNQKDHAAWLHIAIAEMLSLAGNSIADLEAVAVSIGPGSFTGLRVGLATAKGLCYAAQIPLITIGTLELMAFAVKDEAADLVCPMIDARRMEVYAAVYDKSLQEIIPPHALVLTEQSFSPLLSSHKILFSGNGGKKWEPLVKTGNASFTHATFDASHLAVLSECRFNSGQFAPLADTVPIYLKEFYSADRKPLA